MIEVMETLDTLTTSLSLDFPLSSETLCNILSAINEIVYSSQVVCENLISNQIEFINSIINQFRITKEEYVRGERQDKQKEILRLISGFFLNISQIDHSN
jgi:hypothetical protein